MSKLSPLLSALLLLSGGVTAFAQVAVPKPFVATYSATFRGIEGGTIRMELRPDGPNGRYIYETRANPNALAKLFVSRDAIERTTLEATPEGLRPISWEADSGKSGNKGNGKLSFDWTAQIVSGEFEGKPVSLPIEPGVVDRQSIQLGAMLALLRGQEPGAITTVNGDSIRRYDYSRGKSESLDTPLGKLETIVYESTRPGSKRVSRIWHAPSLDYLPVRAEQVRKGKVETVMVLTALERSDGVMK